MGRLAMINAPRWARRGAWRWALRRGGGRGGGEEGCVGELTGVERRALDAIDQSAMVAELAELVAIPSITGTDAEADAQAWVARRLDRMGLDVDHWEMDLAALQAAVGYPG